MLEAIILLDDGLEFTPVLRHQPVCLNSRSLVSREIRIMVSNGRKLRWPTCELKTKFIDRQFLLLPNVGNYKYALYKCQLYKEPNLSFGFWMSSIRRFDWSIPR